MIPLVVGLIESVFHDSSRWRLSNERGSAEQTLINLWCSRGALMVSKAKQFRKLIKVFKPGGACIGNASVM